jgi:hypothetical protein
MGSSVLTTTARLNIVLYQLLHKSSRRNAFLRSRWPGRTFPRHVRCHLDSIDHDELVATARRIVHNVLKGNTRSSGGLLAVYPLTLARLRARRVTPEKVVEAFLESKHFDDYKELPYCGVGLSIEEAFFRFAKQSLVPRRRTVDRAILRHEFLNAIMAILAASPRPHFIIRSRQLVRHNGAAYFSVQTYNRRVLEALHTPLVPGRRTTDYLYAATADGRFVHGAITRSVAGLLTANRGATHSESADLRKRLAELGLVTDSI